MTAHLMGGASEGVRGDGGGGGGGDTEKKLKNLRKVREINNWQVGVSVGGTACT